MMTAIQMVTVLHLCELPPNEPMFITLGCNLCLECSTEWRIHLDETNQVMAGHSLNLGSARAYARTEIHDLI